MKIITKLLMLYAIGDGVVILISLMLDEHALINSQVAFVCSVLITLASFRSYRLLVERRVEAGQIPDDKFEHHYATTEDEEEIKTEQEMPAPKAKVGFKESFKNLSVSYRSVLALSRIVAYGFLFLALLFLIRHELLNPIPFFLGLSVVPLSSFLSVVLLKKDLHETNE